MAPNPIAETSRPPRPNFRFCISVSGCIRPIVSPNRRDNLLSRNQAPSRPAIYEGIIYTLVSASSQCPSTEFRKLEATPLPSSRFPPSDRATEPPHAGCRRASRRREHGGHRPLTTRCPELEKYL